MAKVDPFVIKWPRKWTTDEEIGPVIRYLNRFLHDFWIRTGGGDDFILDLQTRLTILEAEVAALEVRVTALEADVAILQAKVAALEALVFIQVTATADYTTTRNEVITCTNTDTITISLNATPNTIPAQNEEVHVAMAGSRVVVSGNGKLIMGVPGGRDGVSSFTLNIQGQGVQMVFNSDTDKWHIQ